MGVIVEEYEVKGSVPATRFFKAFISKDIRVRVLPQIFKSSEFVEGNGGPGSILHVSLLPPGGVEKSVKFRYDEVDEANRMVKLTTVEDEHLGIHYETVASVFNFEDGPDGGFVLKIATTYHTLGDDHDRIHEIIQQAKHGVSGFFQAANAYLNANPREYN